MEKANLTILQNHEIAKDIYELIVEGDAISDAIAPGQFVHLKVTGGMEPLLRRPISICYVHPRKHRLVMVYRAQGHGTRMLSQRKPGESVDALLPLGSGFPLDTIGPGETALLVGGGIGVPPLYYLGRKLKDRGVQVKSVLGFADREVEFYRSQFAELGDTYVTTVDGSSGLKGYVTDAIEANQIEFDVVYSCGPTPMLRALQQRFAGRRGYISLEERMGCGIGACLACTCQAGPGASGQDYKKICSDGPVFEMSELAL